MYKTMQELREELDKRAQKNSVICINVYDVEKKELVLKHMFQKGWVCVQNHSLYSATGLTYVLTFATKEIAKSCFTM